MPIRRVIIDNLDKTTKKHLGDIPDSFSSTFIALFTKVINRQYLKSECSLSQLSTVSRLA